jgi:hypothetical protein
MVLVPAAYLGRVLTLAIALRIGGKVFIATKRSLGA